MSTLNFVLVLLRPDRGHASRSDLVESRSPVDRVKNFDRGTNIVRRDVQNGRQGHKGEGRIWRGCRALPSPPPRWSSVPSPITKSSGNATTTSRPRTPRSAPPTPQRSDDRPHKPCSPPAKSWPSYLPAQTRTRIRPAVSISRTPCRSAKGARSTRP